MSLHESIVSAFISPASVLLPQVHCPLWSPYAICYCYVTAVTAVEEGTRGKSTYTKRTHQMCLMVQSVVESKFVLLQNSNISTWACSLCSLTYAKCNIHILRFSGCTCYPLDSQAKVRRKATQCAPAMAHQHTCFSPSPYYPPRYSDTLNFLKCSNTQIHFLKSQVQVICHGPVIR